jgi:pilus assembly protein CpaF
LLETIAQRRFGRDPITALQVTENKTLSEPMLELLAAMVKGRLNILGSGTTGAGKTTLLNVLSAAFRTTSASSPSRARPNCR